MKPDIILYPDASMKLSGKNFYSGYGVVVLNPKTNTYVVLDGELSKRSIVYCEAWAIYQGLRYVDYLRKGNKWDRDPLRVLVVSDSKICVDTFTKWIKYNWDTTDWNNWKKSDKSGVKNQDVYRAIMRIISNGHYKVKFVHISSHSNNKPAKIAEIQQNLRASKINLSDSNVKTFIEMNNLADITARSVTDRLMMEENQFVKLEYKQGRAEL